MAKKRFDIHRLLAELRYPTTTGAKVFVAVLALLFVTILALLVVSGFLLYRVVVPQHVGETIDPKQFIASITDVEFQGPGGTTHRGWFFPGLKGAPVIVICHGYGTTRADLLTLATSLQEHRYNVFLFNFAGHGDSEAKFSTLGYREADELMAAIETLTERDDVNHDRVGIWGTSLGAYSALAVAEEMPKVRALVLDSVYREPPELLDLQIGRATGNRLTILKPLARLQFRLLTYKFHKRPRLDRGLSEVANVEKLFIAGSDTPELGDETMRLFASATGPKESVVLPRTNLSSLGDEERRAYENRVLSFFLKALPLGEPPSPAPAPTPPPAAR